MDAKKDAISMQKNKMRKLDNYKTTEKKYQNYFPLLSTIKKV